MSTPLRALLAAVAFAAAPAAAAPSKAHDAAIAALRLDFARDGVVASAAEVAGRYQEACDLGYEPACEWATWRDANDLPSIALASPAFADRCGRNDPVACIVAGWAIEAAPIPTGLSPAERLERLDRQLGDAYPRYVTGCDASFVPACHELARYSIARFRLGVGDAKLLAQRERGAKTVFDIAGCRKGYTPSCVELGKLQPQDPALVSRKGSAGQLFTAACESGDAEGCHQLALLMSGARSADENRDRMSDLCDRGHTDSCAWLARSFGDSESERASALDAWYRACLLHDATGCRIAGQAAESRAPAEAIAVHRMGCRLGDGTSCGRLGLMLVQQDQVRDAVPALDRGCASGMQAACVKVGLLRLEGQRVEPDPRRARADLVRGCPDEGQRDAAACHALGRVYEDGFGVERDRSISARYYRFACIGEHMQSCFRIGEAVSALQRASQSEQLLEWSLDGYVQACNAGIRQSCLPAADLFASGPTSVRDLAEARRRYAGLCDDDDPVGCRRYGSFLIDRSGSEADLSLARDAYSRGRELGDTESTRQLAKMMWYGQGGPRKRAKAQRLFREACRDGNGLSCGGIKQPDYTRR
jgi:uncharacterized protein